MQLLGNNPGTLALERAWQNPQRNRPESVRIDQDGKKTPASCGPVYGPLLPTETETVTETIGASVVELPPEHADYTRMPTFVRPDGTKSIYRCVPHGNVACTELDEETGERCAFGHHAAYLEEEAEWAKEETTRYVVAERTVTRERVKASPVMVATHRVTEKPESLIDRTLRRQEEEAAADIAREYWAKEHARRDAAERRRTETERSARRSSTASRRPTLVARTVFR